MKRNRSKHCRLPGGSSRVGRRCCCCSGWVPQVLLGADPHPLLPLPRIVCPSLGWLWAGQGKVIYFPLFSWEQEGACQGAVVGAGSAQKQGQAQARGCCPQPSAAVNKHFPGPRMGISPLQPACVGLQCPAEMLPAWKAVGAVPRKWQGVPHNYALVELNQRSCGLC